MTANTTPQFINSANVPSVAVIAANTSSEGGGTIATNIFLLFSAGANDSFVEQVFAMPTASAAATNTQATVARLFLSGVSTGTTTSANTFLLAEVVLPQVSADSSTVANNPIAFPIANIRVPANMFLLVTNHAAPAASTQWVFTAVAGNY